MKVLFRTVYLALAIGVALPAAASDPAGAQELTVNSWGGSFQALQREHVFESFAEETGISVTELSDGETMFARARLQVESGTAVMDVMMGDASWLSAGEALDLWAPVDSTVVPVNALYDDAVASHGVAALYWSFNIVSNTERVSEAEAPTTWEEVWAFAAQNPGRVALFGPRPNYVIEVALMADGVPMEEVYPLDEAKLARAYASLDRVRDRVIWYETGDQAQRLLSSGEALVAMFYNGDTFQLIDQGVPLRLTWNQGILTRDYWLVLANAENPHAAQAFMAHASRPEVQAAFARATGFGPTNPASIDLLGDVADRMPTTVANKAVQLSYDHAWWGPREQDLLTAWLAWLQG